MNQNERMQITVTKPNQKVWNRNAEIEGRSLITISVSLVCSLIVPFAKTKSEVLALPIFLNSNDFSETSLSNSLYCGVMNSILK